MMITENTSRLVATVVLFGIIIPLNSIAQSPFKGFENLFTTPLHYVVSYTKQAPIIDGDLKDSVWQAAAWSENFQDIEGDLKHKPALHQF